MLLPKLGEVFRENQKLLYVLVLFVFYSQKNKSCYRQYSNVDYRRYFYIMSLSQKCQLGVK